MMQAPLKILLQTTIPAVADDWHVGRFSLLRSFLQAQVDQYGNSLFTVTARDRSGLGLDPILSTLDTSEYDELWLIGVDDGGGLAVAEREAILRFHRRGGGLLITRDHQDVGASVNDLGRVGAAHFFQCRNCEIDESRHVTDDTETPSISWPNYHSGRNGDFQRITPVAPAHPLLRCRTSDSGLVEYLPAHPHEGAVGVPRDERHAQVIATGRSSITGRSFNLVVAFERVQDEHGASLGRGVAQSSFHHFADYNWDVRKSCPSFVTEPPGVAVSEHPSRLEHVQAYVRNVAQWLRPGLPQTVPLRFA
jgi:hypothetical protein